MSTPEWLRPTLAECMRDEQTMTEEDERDYRWWCHHTLRDPEDTASAIAYEDYWNEGH